MENRLDNIFLLLENSSIHESPNNSSSPLNRILESELNELSVLENEELILKKLEILNQVLLNENISPQFKRELSINGLKKIFKINENNYLDEKFDKTSLILDENPQISDSLFSNLIDNLIYFEDDNLSVDLDLLSLLSMKKIQDQFNDLDVKVKDKKLISGINSLGNFDIDFCFFILKDEIIENLSNKLNEDEIYNIQSKIEDYLEPNAEEFQSLMESIPNINILKNRSLDKYFLSLNKGGLISSSDNILEILRADSYVEKLEKSGLKVFTPFDKMQYDLNSKSESLFKTSPATYSILSVDENNEMNEIFRYSALTNTVSPLFQDDLENTLIILNGLDLKNINLKFNGTRENEVLFLREALSVISKNEMDFDSINVNENNNFVLKEYNQIKQDNKKKSSLKK